MNLNWVHGRGAQMMSDEPNDMLVKIDELACRARETVISEYVPDIIGRSLIRRLLRNPTIRPLLELELNGCTTFQSARILLGEGLVRTGQFKARASVFRGRLCECVEVTHLGREALLDELDGLEENRWIGLLRGAIVGYACVDQGYGICGRREFIEVALELPDPEVLRRIVHVPSGQRQFSVDIGSNKKVKDCERAKSAAWWSFHDEIRRTGRIIDLSESPYE